MVLGFRSQSEVECMGKGPAKVIDRTNATSIYATLVPMLQSTFFSMSQDYTVLLNLRMPGLEMKQYKWPGSS